MSGPLVCFSVVLDFLNLFSLAHWWLPVLHFGPKSFLSPGLATARVVLTSQVTSDAICHQGFQSPGLFVDWCPHMHVPVRLTIATATPVAEPEVEAGTWRGSRCIPVKVCRCGP